MKEWTKNLICIILGTIIGILIVSFYADAKGNLDFTENDHWNLFSIRFTDRITDYVDDETGVHYLVVFDHESMNAICPRYDKDGKVMVDKK